MALICKKCGYKQHDEDTIEYQKKIFPDLEEHDIPYYCGACMDDEDDDYIPSAENGDYSPSNPWDAPGMSIKDFIR